MPWTRSLNELPKSPFEVGSTESRTITVDLTNYLQGGSINSLTVKVLGGPLDSDSLWTDVTSTVQTAAAAIVGNQVTCTLGAFTAGYGYRVQLTWNSSSGTPHQTFQKFYILRCLY